MGIKKSLKKINNLFSDARFGIGFLTNFGMITVALLLFMITKDVLNLSVLGNLNLIFITYLILSFFGYKYILEVDKILSYGFVLSLIVTTIFFIRTYIYLFFSL